MVLPPDVQPVESTAVDALPLPPTVTVPAESVVEPPPEPVRRKPPAKPRPAPPTERVQQPKPPRAVGARDAPAAPSPQRGRAAASRENTGGAAARADPNVLSRYAAKLAAALRSRLRYPEAARAQGVTGVATLRFTMHRSGRVLGASVVRSAGHPALDQAALATARPGSSLPPAPPEIPQQQLTISVPLRFNMR